MDFGALELHFLPGLFAAGTDGLLTRIADGETRLTIRDLMDPGTEGAPHDTEEGLTWLGEPRAGESRRLEATALLPGAGRARCAMQSFGVGPGDRAMFGLGLDVKREATGPGGPTIKDWEIGLLGLACAALAGEDQGAVLLGNDLGPVGVGLARGTVSEQLEGLLQVLGESVEVMVLAPGTAASLPWDAAFEVGSLGDLEERRRK